MLKSITKKMEVTKTSKQDNALDILKLIQPDLLTVEELVHVLRKRGVGPTLLSQNKDKLLSLFKRVALPLPQRQFRENYRGSLLMKLRRKAERLKISQSSTNDSKNYTVGFTGNSTLAKHSLEEKYVSDRLKPPPDVVNYERKKIRLGSTNSSTDTMKHNFSSDLDKIVIKNHKISEISDDSPNEENNIKVVKKSVNECNNSKTNTHRDSVEDVTESGSSITQQCNGAKRDPLPKKVSLKRSYLTSKTEDNSSMSEDKTTSEPDNKRTPITWP